LAIPDAWIQIATSGRCQICDDRLDEASGLAPRRIKEKAKVFLKLEL
jgi:hypothetical protein